jgi:hypothetical protein
MVLLRTPYPVHGFANVATSLVHRIKVQRGLGSSDDYAQLSRPRRFQTKTFLKATSVFGRLSALRCAPFKCGTWFEVRRLCKLALCTSEGVWGPCACACAMPYHNGLPNLSAATDLHDDTQIPCPYSQSISEMPFAACSPFCEFIICFLVFTPSDFYMLFKARS